MALRAEFVQPRLMIEMNATPLIDLMLVLLIMLIITIPIQTHAVKSDLPQPCTRCAAPNPVKNEIAITRDGGIAWDDTPVTESELRYELALTRGMRPEPELHLRPNAAARYEVVDRVLAVIKRSGVGKFGFVGNEAYANW